MQIGKMRFRLIIEHLTPDEAIAPKDQYGTPIRTWTQFDERWADIIPIDGTEPWMSELVAAQITHLVEMRYVEGLKTYHRFRLKNTNRIFNIKGIADVHERHRIHKVRVVEEDV